MQDFEKLGLFYLGRGYDMARGPRARRGGALRLARPGDPRRLRRDDRERQDRALSLAHRGGRHRRRAGHRHRPQGRPRQPAPDLPRICRPRSSVPGSTRTKRAARGRRPTPLPPAKRSGGGRGWPSGGRTAPGSSGCGTPPSSRSTRRAAAPAFRSRSSARLPPLRPRRAPTASCSPSAPPAPPTSVLALAGARCPAAQPRAHARDQALRGRLAPGARSRSRHAHSAGADAAVRQGRRRRSRGVLSGQGSLRAGDAAQRAAGGAWLRAVARGRAARPGQPALLAAGQAAGRGLLDRASGRRRAHVLRVAAAQPGRGVDARADRHDEPAGRALHGRDRRLLSAGGEPAVEGAR